ncbi:hypothetical protein REC12_08185 [Desulfosporosinus sp. PR]|uniref:hypothetical protein n=1 Tax=Candidatus Desulfosporosinus nitrosoreducens TaxID=3401928 RepID=UPI0027FDB6F9|nr:hypothetical protein [Desulfosporosinus sp. PR]MDQ7093564.1 hypothetical protein [Desulfosporosinus sp. PR]
MEEAILEALKQSNTRFYKQEARFDSLEKEIKKNLLPLENMYRNIQIIGEVPKSHLEQNERQHKEMMAELKGETGLLGTAVRHISNRKKT